MSTYPVQWNMPPTVEGAYSHAWRILTRHFWPLMGMLGIWIASQAPAFVLGAAAAPLQENSPLAWLLLQLMSSGWSLFVTLPLQYGLFRACVRMARGEQPDFMDVAWAFRSVRAYFSVLGSAILLGLALMAAMIPAIVVMVIFIGGAALAAARGGGSESIMAVVAAIGIGALLAFALALLPVIWLACRLLFTQFCVADGEAGPLEGLSRSWEMTRGHAGTVFLLTLVAVPLLIVAMILCCLPVIPAIGLFYLAEASLYLALGGGPRTPPAPMAQPVA